VFNLLVSGQHDGSHEARREIEERLAEVGARIERLEPSEIEGIFLVTVIMVCESPRECWVEDIKKVVAHLRDMCRTEPEKFAHTVYWVPIEFWVPSSMPEMVAAVNELSDRIQEHENWKMQLHKRGGAEHTAELIKALTEPIEKGHVNLENPEKIVVVEILGDYAGFSVIAPSELLDVGSIKRSLMREAR
jgi:tRNA acetyltransferase TAN1